MDQIAYNEYLKELNEDSLKKLNSVKPGDRASIIEHIYNYQKDEEKFGKAEMARRERRNITIVYRVFYCVVAVAVLFWVFSPGETPEEAASRLADEQAVKAAELAAIKRNACLSWRKGNDWPAQRFFRQACGSNGFKQFASSDGSHKQSVIWVESQLHNPDSFEHLETNVAGLENPHQTEMIIVMTFRATNGFGAVVKNKAHVEVDKRSGEVLGGEISSL